MYFHQITLTMLGNSGVNSFFINQKHGHKTESDTKTKVNQIRKKNVPLEGCVCNLGSTEFCNQVSNLKVVRLQIYLKIGYLGH